MNCDSTEWEYLLKARYFTWEYVKVLEDHFGTIRLNDKYLKNESDHISSPDTLDSKESSWLHSAKNKISGKKTSCIYNNENISGGTHVYVNPTIVFSVQVVLSNVGTIEQNIDTHVGEEKYSQTPVNCKSGLNANGKSNVSARYHCSICHEPFHHKVTMTRHFRSHTGEKPFSCSQCEKTFAKKGNLNRHLLVHSGTRNYSCEICYKLFTQKGDLKRHQMIHSGTKDYSCDICYKTFTQKGNLKGHQLVHTGTKQYSCDICYKSFARKCELKLHLLIHSGTKPYSCDICYKTFVRKGYLADHRHVHTGDKPYKCTKCDAMFAYKQSLVKHGRTHTV